MGLGAWVKKRVREEGLHVAITGQNEGSCVDGNV